MYMLLYLFYMLCLVYQDLIMVGGDAMLDLHLPSVQALLEYLKEGERNLGVQVRLYLLYVVNSKGFVQALLEYLKVEERN